MATIDAFITTDNAAAAINNRKALLDLVYSDDEFALLRETLWIYSEMLTESRNSDVERC